MEQMGADTFESDVDVVWSQKGFNSLDIVAGNGEDKFFQNLIHILPCKKFSVFYQKNRKIALLFFVGWVLEFSAC